MQLRTFVGFPFSRAVAIAAFFTRCVLLAMNPRTFHHLDIVSVSHHTETSCWFIGLGFLSSTLVKLLNLFVHPYLVKQKKKKKESADKEPQIADRPTF